MLYTIQHINTHTPPTPALLGQERGFLDYSYFEGLKEAPTYVVFNGTEGEHTERAPLIADQV